MNALDRLTLRDATLEDAPTLLRLMVEAFREYEGILDPPSGAHSETIETVGRWLAKGAAVIACDAGEPAGFAFYRPDGDFVYFGRLSVLPAFRSKGIGRALLAHVENRAQDTGARGVRLGVRLQLPHLVARYERLGYRITKQMTHEGYLAPTFVYMEKQIPDSGS